MAIIHCVGSRDANYNAYCSRVCCMYSLKFAHLVREKLPEAACYEFFIDMRAFGKGYEEFMERIRSEGTHVVRGRTAQVIEHQGQMFLKGEDILSDQVVELPVDMVILALGLVPALGTRRLAEMLRVPLDPDGWFSELNYNGEPIQTERGGIFVAGMCQSPKDIPDTVAQARAAAARILARIAKGQIEIDAVFVEVDENRCSGCRLCNTVCPYSAVEFDEGRRRSHVQAALCKACGTCVSACPSGAIKGRHFTDQQLCQQIESLFA